MTHPKPKPKALSSVEERFLERAGELRLDIMNESSLSVQHKVGMASLCAAEFLGAAAGGFAALHRAKHGETPAIQMDEWVRTVAKVVCDIALTDTTQ